MKMKTSLVLFGALSLAACSVAPYDDSAEQAGGGEEVRQTSQALTTSQRKAAIDAKRSANTWLGAPAADYFTTVKPGMARDYAYGTIAIGDAVNRAHSVTGLIRGKWWAKGAADGFLGFPTTDESTTFYGDGKFNYFQGGTIYWKSGASAAYEVHGCHNDVYGRMGWEWSALGFPTTDEITVDNRKVSRFEAGNLYTRTGASGSNCADLSWPVLTKDNGNAYHKVRVQGKGFITATLSANLSGARLSVKGENFKPGESLTFKVNNPAYSKRVSMPNWKADAYGKFNIAQPGGTNWFVEAEDLKSVNGWVTVAVYGDQGSFAVTQSYTSVAVPYPGTM
jgi:hypothetical protein